MATPTPTATPEFLNASSSFTSSFGTTTDLVPIIGLVLYASIGLVAAQYLTANYRRYAILAGAVDWLTDTFEYFLKGVATAVLIAVTYAPIWLLGQADGETQGFLGLALVALVAGYAALTALGYVADRLYSRARRHHDRVHYTADPEGAGGE